MDAEMGQFVIPWETPYCFGSGKKTHPIFQFVSLEKKEESNTWWEEQFIPQLTQEEPIFNLIWEGALTQVWS